MPRSDAEKNSAAAADSGTGGSSKSVPVRASSAGGKGDGGGRVKPGGSEAEDGRAKVNEKMRGGQEGGGSRSGVFEDEGSAGTPASTGGSDSTSNGKGDGRIEDDGSRAYAEDAAATEGSAQSSRDNAAAGGVTDDVAAGDEGDDAEYEAGDALSDGGAGAGHGKIKNLADAERREGFSRGGDSSKVEADADSTSGLGSQR